MPVIPGAPAEARWLRGEPRRKLAADVLERIIKTALPGRRAVDAQPLADGWRNANFKVQLEPAAECVVLRIYEHEVSLCRKETDLLQVIRDVVPVPEIIHAEPEGLDEIPPFAVWRFVEGITLRDLIRSRDATAIAEAACAVGRTLAAIGQTRFSSAGWLAPGPAVTRPLMDGADPVPRFAEQCLASANLQRRMSAELRDRTLAMIWSAAPDLAQIGDQNRLVHGDFGKRNLLVRQVDGAWTVAAVLDWEFAVSGSPLSDVGHLLRYECVASAVMEPHFSDSFHHAGGELPPGWRRLARAIDSIALCESLTHDELPDAVTAELLELICATVEDRDPRIP
jgi:aminoglycoside phosphotransferase (APT) family kinase protein